MPGSWNAAFPELLEYEDGGWYATTKQSFDLVASIYNEMEE